MWLPAFVQDPERVATSARSSDTLKTTILFGQYALNKYRGHYYAKCQNLARSPRAALESSRVQKVESVTLHHFISRLELRRTCGIQAYELRRLDR